MTRSTWLSDAPAGVIAAWWWAAVAFLFALAIAWEPTARILAPRDFEADEKQCRAEQQKAYAEVDAATGSGNQPKPNAKERAEREKNAREYCVQRRSAVAGERQGDIAQWAAIVSFLALIAAGVAAVAALRTVRTMQGTAQSELRAYVFARNVHISGFPEADMTLSYQIHNFGQTPAYKVACVARAFLGDFPTPKGLVEPEEPPRFVGDMAPSATISQTVGCRKLTAEELEAIKGKTRALYITGTITYVDAFGRDQTTEFMRFKSGDHMEGTTMHYFGDRNRAT